MCLYSGACQWLLYTPDTAPVIEECREVINACEGEQVTLKIKVSGMPKPTITWSTGGRMVEGGYATEIEQDGSLTFVSVELKHTGTYHFTAANREGKAEGITKLVVHSEREWKKKFRSGPTVESKPVQEANFGDYVSSLHAHQNAGFTSQYWVHIIIWDTDSAELEMFGNTLIGYEFYTSSVQSLPTGESGHTENIVNYPQ